MRPGWMLWPGASWRRWLIRSRSQSCQVCGTIYGASGKMTCHAPGLPAAKKSDAAGAEPPGQLRRSRILPDLRSSPDKEWQPIGGSAAQKPPLLTNGMCLYALGRGCLKEMRCRHSVGNCHDEPSDCRACVAPCQDPKCHHLRVDLGATGGNHGPQLPDGNALTEFRSRGCSVDDHPDCQLP